MMLYTNQPEIITYLLSILSDKAPPGIELNILTTSSVSQSNGIWAGVMPSSLALKIRKASLEFPSVNMMTMTRKCLKFPLILLHTLKEGDMGNFASLLKGVVSL